MPVEELNNISLKAFRLDFFVDGNTKPDIGESVLNGFVSHIKPVRAERKEGSWSRAKWPLGMCASVKPQRSVDSRQVVVVVGSIQDPTIALLLIAM